MKYLVVFLFLLTVIIPTALATPQMISEESTLKFIDFSYTHTVGVPIQFIIEKTRDADCNSYNAKITDDEGNFILGWGEEISCNPTSISVPIQTKIGYKENKPIIINESGKYYLEVEFDDAVITREFVVRQNHSGGSLDPPVYPIPFDMPSPHKQMKLGIKLGHIICDKDKFPVWNIHYKPACVYPDTESELIKRGWAKLRLMLPASADPIKELEIMGQNEFSYRVMGNLVYGNEEYPLSYDRKKEIAWEYSQKYHPEENYLEYAVISHEKHHDVGDKIQFDLLEWGNYSDCWDLRLRIIDMYDQSVFENNLEKFCVDHNDTSGTFNLYSMEDDFEEFICDKPGYYRIEVSNGDIFPSTILENFACLNSEPMPESELLPLDIASVEDKFIHLNPVDTCATISLRLLSSDDLKQTTSGTKDIVFFELDEKDMDEFPVLGELIRATHHIKSPSNEYAQTEIGLREFVDYEFFIMGKAIAKYNDTQDDYFMKLDVNLDEKLADPKKQGFSNEFIAPQIVYKDNVYSIGSTVFWKSDEHEMHHISISVQDNLKEDEKYVILTDKDMDSVPKIKQTIEKIGTELESIVAFKGMPENPDWNNYREWFDQKNTEQYNLDEVYVKGFVYEGEYYDLGFPIC